VLKVSSCVGIFNGPKGVDFFLFFISLVIKTVRPLSDFMADANVFD
jgi:hypothetical protein